MTDEYDHITTAKHVQTYDASHGIFEALLREVRELSRKKPDATLNAGKVKIINRVLADLLTFLKDEPEGKYLEELDDDSLPQVSDAVLIMVQFETALESFHSRYFRRVSDDLYAGAQWITEELVAELKDRPPEDAETEED